MLEVTSNGMVGLRKFWGIILYSGSHASCLQPAVGKVVALGCASHLHNLRPAEMRDMVSYCVSQF